MFQRALKPLKSQSFFLFGARATGKSTFVQSYLGDEALYLDLLDPVLEDRLIRFPNDLKAMVSSAGKPWVILDEVQKAPKLLDVVHQLIFSTQQKFVLTGSSARKLRRGEANLLAGRAHLFHLHPLVSSELSDRFSLTNVLQFGSLPGLLTASSDRERRLFLQAYGLTYLKEEIAAEQVIRRIEPFRHFLRVAAQQSGKVVNHSSIGKQLGVDHKTVVNYFSILEDTLVGFSLPGFHESPRKSFRLAPKFFLFDLGVRNALAEELDWVPHPGNSHFGSLFEHFLILECLRLNEYAETQYRMSHLLTESQFEVDLILSKGRNNLFVEINSSDRIDSEDVSKWARKISRFSSATKGFYVSQDRTNVEMDGVQCLHWSDFLKQLFPLP